MATQAQPALAEFDPTTEQARAASMAASALDPARC
jgi:hypothetical protein